jgi:hypothetical protein
MSILTGSELEFLDSLKANWSRLYHNELARLVKEAYNRGDGRHALNVPESDIEWLEQRQ